MAAGAGARILPVSVEGTRRILPAKGTHVHDGEHVRVVVHEPVVTSGDQKALMGLVRERIQSALPAPG